MTRPRGRLYYLGRQDAVAQQIASEVGRKLESGFPTEAAAGDLVFIEVFSAGGGTPLPGGNAFAACRTLKQTAGVEVFLLAEAGDTLSAEIGRFCMANGCLSVAAGALQDVEELRSALTPHRAKVSADLLLEELEQRLASDEGRKASAIQRMLGRDRQEWVLEMLTDRETGLFDGPYASFKLDEEFKRALRFHQPLGLVLLDIGDEGLPAEETARKTCLAEVAAVFLNECRDIDTLARFTETTFLFLLPGTGADGAAVLARRMLDALEGRGFSGNAMLDPHAGVATVPAAGITRRDEFLARAEACLQLAQRGEGEGGLCASWE